MTAIYLTRSTLVGSPVGEEIQALSSDEPPVVGPDAQPLPDGSTLHLVDTGECYVFHAGAWVPDLRLARAIRHSAAL